MEIKKCSLIYRMYVSCVLICMFLFSTTSFAINIHKPLPAEKAFQFSYVIKEHNHIVAKWHIAPGYYLYRKHMQIVTTSNIKIDVQYPQGEIKEDPVKQAANEVYTNDLSIPIVLQSNADKIQLSIDYQGCSDRGFCYPPMHQNVMFDFKGGSPVANAPAQHSSFSTLLTDQNSVRSLFYSKHLFMMMSLFVGLGLLLAFTPCVFPMIPILTGIIVGQKQVASTKKAFLLSLSYVLGSAITYALAGLLAASMGGTLQVWLQKPWIIATASGLFVLLSLSLFGLYEIRLPNRLMNLLNGWSNKQAGGTYIGATLMGVLSTLIVSPCVTAPLVGVLMYISQTGDRLLGASALFAMGLGMGIPLLIIGTSAGKWLPKSGSWMDAVKHTFGFLMLAMAIWMLSRVVPQSVTTLLWGALLVSIAIFLGAYLPRLVGSYRFNRGLGLAVGFSGMLVMFGGAGMMPNSMMEFIQPKHLALVENNFKTIHSVEEFNQELKSANSHNKPVVLDFYADWCESCVAMDRYVFNTSNVQQKLSKYVLLRVDLSQNSAADEALLKHFDVIAPPTILFFDAQGREVDAQRVVGEINAQELLGRLKDLRGQTSK